MAAFKISMRACIFFACLLFCQQSIAQSPSKRLLGSFIVKDTSFNYEFTMDAVDSYSLGISSIADAPQGEGASSSNSSPVEKNIFSEFSQQVFETVFQQQMKQKYKMESDAVRKVATEVFFKIKARLDFIDDEPVTAYFILKKDYIYSLLRYNNSKSYNGALSLPLLRHYIHRVEMETNDGTLKNISVYLVDPKEISSQTASPRKFLLFKNQFPISISGKFDYEKLSKINLYCFNCSGIDRLARYIRLSDLVILDIVYENDKEDYSPANRTFSLTPNKPITELKKERRSRLLEIAAFSDFIGLDQNEPNGLIQIEAKRRININTRHRLWSRGKDAHLSGVDLSEIEDWKHPIEVTDRYTVYKTKDSSIRIPNTRGKFKSVYFNYFGYVEPKLLFSKLEDNNRLLDSAKAINGQIDPISIFRYQLASFGVNVQVFRLSFPQIKLQWNVLNAGMFWSRTRVATTTDSTGPSEPLNSNYWTFESNLTFRPDNRWGASLGLGYMKGRLWNKDYSIITNKGLFQNQFDAWLRTGDDGKLFFRYRWTYENKNRNNNFTQLQLGYSLNLFAASGNGGE